MTRPTPAQWALLVPALLVVAVLLVAPNLLMAVESFQPFVPGRAGSGAGWTVRNYTELIHQAYAFYFADTFRIGFLASRMAVGLGAPLAWLAARTRRHGIRLGIFGLLIGLLFLSIIARLYAIQMTWGATGPLAIFGRMIGIPAQSPGYAEVQVMIGLVYFVLPLAALTLIETFQNISPRLAKAAASLGAPRWKIAFSVTLPLAVSGLLSAFMIAFAMCISNFVVPLIWSFAATRASSLSLRHRLVRPETTVSPSGRSTSICGPGLTTPTAFRQQSSGSCTSAPS